MTSFLSIIFIDKTKIKMSAISWGSLAIATISGIDLSITTLLLNGSSLLDWGDWDNMRGSCSSKSSDSDSTKLLRSNSCVWPSHIACQVENCRNDDGNGGNHNDLITRQWTEPRVSPYKASRSTQTNKKTNRIGQVRV